MLATRPATAISSPANSPSASSAMILRKPSSIAWPSLTSPVAATFPPCSTPFPLSRALATGAFRAKVKRPSNSSSPPHAPAMQRLIICSRSSNALREMVCRFTALSLPRATTGSPPPGSAPRPGQPHELRAKARRQQAPRHRRSLAGTGSFQQHRSRRPKNSVSSLRWLPARQQLHASSRPRSIRAAEWAEHRAARPVPVAAKPISQAQAATALDRQDQLLAGLLLGSPEFQRR